MKVAPAVEEKSVVEEAPVAPAMPEPIQEEEVMEEEEIDGGGMVESSEVTEKEAPAPEDEGIAATEQETCAAPEAAQSVTFEFGAQFTYS